MADLPALSTADFRAALNSARQLHRSGGDTVLDILQRTTRIDSVSLAQALRRLAGVDMLVDGATAKPDFSRIDLARARHLGVVPLSFGAARTGHYVGMADPWDDARIQALAAELGAVPVPVALPGALIAQWLGAETSSPSSGGGAAVSGGDSAPSAGLVVSFVDDAIRSAFANGASDIHFECDRVGVTVKFRQDGVMARFTRLDDPTRAEEVISRIKVLAQLDITERRTPQDGRFRFAIAEARIDLRVSIMPSVFGEDAVLRLLDKAQLRTSDETASLGHLGFDLDSAVRIRDLAELPHGMLLVTGPTGSGKTTTVYAVLSEINDGLEKIITIEDPVEYELPGVLQIPVNERKGLTFAKGLRSILRHDPDRILVGEIRDAETAEIAVQSALTGHQVFTTVHANSVFDVTGRFRHFGLDMFGFMASLNGVVVQRLLRRLCPACVRKREPSDRERAWLAAVGQEITHVPIAVGCDACRSTGYRGRVVLAEVHTIDDGFRDLVTSVAPVSALREHVRRLGVPSLAIQAGAMVRDVVTTPEEIKRVVGWN